MQLKTKKNPLSSKTFWGLAIALVGMIIDWTSIGLSEEIVTAWVSNVIDVVAQFVQLGGLAFAAYGRAVATKQIGV